MVNKCLILFILIANICFCQEYDKDKFIELTHFEFQEILNNSKSLSGNYYIIHSKKGKIISVDIKRYLKGEKTGEWLGFLSTIGVLNLASVFNYENNKLHGYFFITDNHTYYEEGYYKNGKKYGLWTKKVFYDNDVIETIRYNKDGLKHGEYTKIDYESEEKEVISYKNGKKHGKYYLENKKYKKTTVGVYKNDLKHGVWVMTDKYLTVINEDGSETPSIKKEYYRNGILIKKE